MRDFDKTIIDLKTQLSNDEEVEIDISTSSNIDDELNKQIHQVEDSINERTKKIEKLTSHADKLDYIFACACGVLTGVLDVVFVGECSLSTAHEWGTEQCNKCVMNFANALVKKDGRFENQFTDLKSAIEYLEGKYHINYDIANKVMGNGDHHLFDFAHHASLFGLIISIIAQLSGKTFGWNTVDKTFSWVDVSFSNYQVKGKNVAEKFFNAIINWGCHSISDMSGSSTAKKGGTGIPGPIMSMLQEGSRFFKKGDSAAQSEIQTYLNKAFKGQLKGQNGVPFDLRTELGIYNNLGKQSLVVILNEVVVRAFYFIRRLILEIKEKNVKSFKNLDKIDWMNVIPSNNRTITRMLTVSLTTLSAIDIVEASIRSLIKSGGNLSLFISNLVVRINYVGLGRTAVAVFSDASMGIRLDCNKNKRIDDINKYLALNNAKLFYKQADLWVLVDDIDKSIDETTRIALATYKLFEQNLKGNKADLKKINDTIDQVDKKNPGIKKDIKDILKWGKK